MGIIKKICRQRKWTSNRFAGRENGHQTDLQEEHYKFEEVVGGLEKKQDKVLMIICCKYSNCSSYPVIIITCFKCIRSNSFLLFIVTKISFSLNWCELLHISALNHEPLEHSKSEFDTLIYDLEW